MQTYKVEITFTEPLLGTAPLEEEIYTLYIADKKADMTPVELRDEIESLREDKGVTGFHRNGDDEPFLYDYMIEGFLKDACGMMRRARGTLSKKLTAYKKVIDGLVFVGERRIPLQMAGELDVLERPLRAETAQGPRVALAKSEMAPVGTKIAFTLRILDDKSVPLELLQEWFDYGSMRGLGQWRNGGYGRFEYTIMLA